MIEEDKELKKLAEALMNYCREKKYTVAIAAGTDGENLFAAQGKLDEVADQLTDFAKHVEINRGYKNFVKEVAQKLEKTAKRLKKEGGKRNDH